MAVSFAGMRIKINVVCTYTYAALKCTRIAVSETRVAKHIPAKNAEKISALRFLSVITLNRVYDRQQTVIHVYSTICSIRN